MEIRELSAALRARKLDPRGLCHYLARRLIREGQPCDHTHRLTHEYITEYRGITATEADAIVSLLREEGYHCDCEVGNNLCAELAG